MLIRMINILSAGGQCEIHKFIALYELSQKTVMHVLVNISNTPYLPFYVHRNFKLVACLVTVAENGIANATIPHQIRKENPINNYV